MRTRAGDRLAVAGDLGARGDHVGLHALGDAEEALAGRRQLAAGGVAAEQFCVEGGLERGDAARHGGVVEVEPARRAEDLPGAGDGEEDAGVIPVHGSKLQAASRVCRRLSTEGARRNAPVSDVQ